MIDDNWELISGETAHEIEVLNYSNQVNVIEALVRFIMHHHETSESGCKASPSLTVLQEFHRTATLFLLEKPGVFREEEVVVQNNGVVIHTPPTFDTVQSHMENFFKLMVERWPSFSAVDAGAYTLWLINWVHPFKNGNGRSARAFCYACVSLKLGFVLPGSPTLIDLIMQNRNEYQDALKAADISYESTGEPDLTLMGALVERLLVEQLSTVTD